MTGKVFKNFLNSPKKSQGRKKKKKKKKKKTSSKKVCIPELQQSTQKNIEKNDVKLCTPTTL